MTKRKLKLCFIGDFSNVHCKRWVHYFVDQGHEVHLIDDHDFSYKDAILHRLQNKTGIAFLDYLLRLFNSRRIIRKIKPDLVHAQQLTYHGFVGALSGIHPYLITPWGSDILSEYDSSWFNKKIVHYVLNKSDLIHYIDTSVYDRVLKIYGETKEKSFVLNEGTDVDLYQPNRSKSDRVVILSMRMPSRGYNPILFVEALNILVNEHGVTNISCIMCNKGDVHYQRLDYEKMLMEKVKEYKLEPYIEFFTWSRDVTFAQTQFVKSDIYIDTMVRNEPGQGTGKTVLEAMASGLALILPDNPGVEIYLKDKENGLLYERDNASALADALRLLVESEELRKKLSGNARKFIETELNWSVNMKKMEGHYQELIKNFR